jgi:hypothetical protein
VGSGTATRLVPRSETAQTHVARIAGAGGPLGTGQVNEGRLSVVMDERMMGDGGREGVGLGRATELGAALCTVLLGPIKPPIAAATKQLYLDTVKGIMLQMDRGGPWGGGLTER